MKSNYLTLKDFVSVEGCNIMERAELFSMKYVPQLKDAGLWDLWMVIENCHDSSHIELQGSYNDTYYHAITFVSNDYLGYSKDYRVINAGIDTMKKFGAGTCAAPIIGGYLRPQWELEKAIAKFLACEDALVFSSGFGANAGVLLALLRKNDIAIVDMYAHASVFEGLYNTNIKITKHNDPDYLDSYLARVKTKYDTKLVIVDGVYSQDGDVAPLPDILEVCRRHGAYLLIDDAHGIGVWGETGRGAIEHFGLLGKVDFVTGTLSKSIGTVGGFFAGSQKVVDYLRLYARTCIFSAAPTPQVLGSALCSFGLIDKEPERRERIRQNYEYLNSRLKELGFDTGCTVSQIIPIKIGDDMKTKIIVRKLLERGIYTCGITYPGVKLNDARIRLGVLAMHSKEDLDSLVDALISVDKELHIRDRFV